MGASRRLVRAYAGLAVALMLSFAQVAAAGDRPVVNIRIDNFGQINDHYYRGGQPDDQDFKDLAALGIRTVIDLQKDGSAGEQRLVESAGMNFYRIPMTTTDRPSDAAVQQFLSLVNNPANQPVYVHCQGGRHRTGVMTAAYRMTQDGWTADQAYAEMKKYGFETLIGHPVLKKFVYDFYTTLGAQSGRATVKAGGS
jgi:protein tyrosine phosphatase (PTP) superfamily phosphohydrolase (DUF442 family)